MVTDRVNLCVCLHRTRLWMLVITFLLIQRWVMLLLHTHVVQDCARFSSPLKSRKKRWLRRQLSFHTHSSCPFHSNFFPSPPPLLKKEKKKRGQDCKKEEYEGLKSLAANLSHPSAFMAVCQFKIHLFFPALPVIRQMQ